MLSGSVRYPWGDCVEKQRKADEEYVFFGHSACDCSRCRTQGFYRSNQNLYTEAMPDDIFSKD